MVFFVDTNFFLQHKNINELDWSQVTSDKQVTIIVPKPVIEEIDRLKHDGNHRRARRSRTASSFFGRIIKSGEHPHVILTKTHQIKLDISWNPSLIQISNASENLNKNKADDMIVASMIAFKNLHSDANVSLLTGDNGPQLTCFSLDLPFVDIPDEWRLPPESDPRDKKINKLAEENRMLKAKSPKVSLQVIIGSDRNTEESKLIVQQCLKLSEEEVETIIEHYSERFPPKKFNSDNDDSHLNEEDNTVLKEARRTRALISTLRRPSEVDIENYTNTIYPAWQRHLRQYLVAYPSEKSKRLRILPFTVILENSGTYPIDGAILRIQTQAGALLCPPQSNYQYPYDVDIPEPPNPPKPPPGRADALRGSMAHLFDMNGSLIDEPKHEIYNATESAISLLSTEISNPPKHDPNTFYWRECKPLDASKEWGFTCDEFMHQDGSEEFNYYLVTTLAEEDMEIVLQVTLGARNLPKPVTIIQKKRIEIQEVSVFDELLEKAK